MLPLPLKLIRVRIRVDFQFDRLRLAATRLHRQIVDPARWLPNHCLDVALGSQGGRDSWFPEKDLEDKLVEDLQPRAGFQNL